MSTKQSKKVKSILDLAPVSVKYELKHPVSGEGLDVFVDLVGPDSHIFRAAVKAHFQRQLSKAEKANETTQTVDEVEAESDKLIAACIVGWEDEEFFTAPYSAEKALELVSDPNFSWFRAQVNDYTNNRANFFKG